MKFCLLLSLLSFPLLIQAQTSSKPTVAEAGQFMDQAEARLNLLTVKTARAVWVQENFITDDTEALSADAQDQITAVVTELVDQSKRFDGLQMPPQLARKFMLLKLGLTAPAPHDPALRKEMTTIATSLDARRQSAHHPNSRGSAHVTGRDGKAIDRCCSSTHHRQPHTCRRNSRH